MQHIRIQGSIRWFYPYRTAILSNWHTVVILDDEELKYIGHKLSMSGFGELDNHIVFATDNCNYWLHDGRLCIGGEIVMV